MRWIATRWVPTVLLAGLTSLSARAVVVRGVVTDGQGRRVANARVQLIFGKTTASYATSRADGSFEIRDGDGGRFVLLTSAVTFAPNISEDFYGGKMDIVMRSVVMSPTEIRTEVSVTATGLATPLPQLTAPVELIARDALATRVGVVDELRQAPGVFVVQQGQAGGVSSLFVRGGGSDATKVLFDGVPADDVGGAFDYGTVSSTGVSGPGAGTGLELYRGANSATAGTDALAGVLQMTTPRGSTMGPVLNYSGDAGNLHAYRNEVFVSGTRKKLDYLAGYSRFETSNALRNDEYHSGTAVANVGYALGASTLARFTLRNADSAVGLPDAYDFYLVPASGKQSDQDLYAAGTVENTTLGGWHNLVRYGITRKREQAEGFQPVGEPVTSTFDGFSFTTYYGLPATIRGANGYTATGQAAFFTPTDQTVSNRDQLYFQSDYVLPHHVAMVFGFRYDNERGSFVGFGAPEQLQRTNFGYSLGFQGELGARVFYSFGGAIEKNHLFGLAGTPRLGLAYQAVRPGGRFLHGTRLRANVSTGVQEPSLALEYASLYRELLASGNVAAIAQYGVGPATALRSRTFDVGVDQSLLGEKLVLKAGYFHNQFSHQFDFVDAGTLQALFGLNDTLTSSLGNSFGGAELNSLAYRAQGLEADLEWQPKARILVRGGYTYLATLVEQSFASDAAAVAAGTPTENPDLPGIAIGATSPLVGQRVFRRPPQTGYFAAQYTGSAFGVAFKGSMASKSDDSTFLSFEDLNGGNTLLLPNRNLDFGYVKLDLGVTYAVNHHVTVFAQTENLLNDQHIGPIGYPGLPLTARGGLKVRLGGGE